MGNGTFNNGDMSVTLNEADPAPLPCNCHYHCHHHCACHCHQPAPTAHHVVQRVTNVLYGGGCATEFDNNPCCEVIGTPADCNPEVSPIVSASFDAATGIVLIVREDGTNETVT